MKQAGMLKLFMALAFLVGCAPPSSSPSPGFEIAGRWVVKRGPANEIGAEMTLGADGRAIVRNWPGSWLGAGNDRRLAGVGTWSRQGAMEDVVGFLEIDHPDAGARSTNMPIYFDRRGLIPPLTECLTFGVRDPDDGLPCFERQAAAR